MLASKMTAKNLLIRLAVSLHPLKMLRPLLLLSIIFSALTLFGCKSNNENGLNTDLIYNPGKPMNAEDSARMPIITFDTLQHHFGEITEGDVVSFDFKFSNLGKGNLLISEVKATCGCTTPYYPKDVIKPGESEVIKVSYDSHGRPGAFRKGVTVTSNTYPNTTKLIISGTVIPKS